MLISVFADKAPAGIFNSTKPSAEVIDPPEAPIVSVTGSSRGIPTGVTAGGRLPLLLLLLLLLFEESIFLQPANKIKTQKVTAKMLKRDKGNIKKVFSKLQSQKAFVNMIKVRVMIVV